MGRFPWSQGHSKHGGDGRAQTIAHDWFSKDRTEPPRQALTDLMRDQSSFESSGGDVSPQERTRSRTDTVTSSVSVYTRSLSDGSNDLTSRPSSEQSFVDTGMPLPLRHESTARTLLARGTRILKRQGSKLTLLPLQIDDKSSPLPVSQPGEVSPGNGLLQQPTSSPKGLKRSISGPFAFQHLTHADQARFQSLDSVSKTDLSSEFNAVHSDQQPDDQIRGISVADLPAKDDQLSGNGLHEPASPTIDAIPYLPITPPRPSPPPKDGLMSPYSPPDFRLSRSMENFSRPTRLSVTTVDISPATTSERLSAMSPVSQAKKLAKPLPHLPDGQLVHAVSTRDDIALPLPTAPLPSPPKAVMAVVEEDPLEEREPLPTSYSYSRLATLHSFAFPTPKKMKRRSQSSGDLQLDSVCFGGASETLTAARDNMRDVSAESSPKSKARISMAIKAAGMEGWEDAIDDSWDAAELEEEADAYGPDLATQQSSNMTIPSENYLVVEQTHMDETMSSASTPLMMQAPEKPYREAPASETGDHPSALLGLGIDSLQRLPNVCFDELRSSPQPETELNFSSSDGYQSRPMRSPVSVMSKSSSQESFIASIFGTQRSSNSSTSLSDFAHLASGSFEGSMESLKLDFQEFSSIAPSDKHFREGSQDTIREESLSTKSKHLLGHTNCLGSVPRFSTSPTLRHDRGASASAIPQIPQRTSSIADVAEATKSHVGRKRATTGTSRPRRNPRVSYSLFPTAMPN